MPNPEGEKQRRRDELAEAFALAQLRRDTDSRWQAVEEDLWGLIRPGWVDYDPETQLMRWTGPERRTPEYERWTNGEDN
jgi:hypothetical protein